MQILLGHQEPVWLSLEVRPYVDSQRLEMELGGVRFEIPDSNWYVTTPYVESNGLPFLRNRISGNVSRGLVNGTYARKHEIESQVAAAAPALVEKLTDRINE